jgi:DNA invertase Pin-like site-specific DNA recombinase
MFLTFIAGMNQFEREVMLERQAEGIAAMPVNVEGKKISAKTGRGFGRTEIDVDVSLMPGENVTEACKRLGISRATYYRKAKEISCRA